MRPLEAYNTVMRFAADYGELSLQLASHVAVPQGFSLEILHLLRLNFVPEASFEHEADVLLASFCEDLGGGYYSFDLEARRLLLTNLDPVSSVGEEDRVRRVADFLVAYIENCRGSLAAENDRLLGDFLAIQGWVALAFLDPDQAAVQLARALKKEVDQEISVRLQLSGLFSALKTPLSKYPQLLAYAAGLEALEQGRAEDAAAFFDGLPEEIIIGEVKLNSPRQILRQATGLAGRSPEVGSRVVGKKSIQAWRIGHVVAPADFTPFEMCGWSGRFDDPQHQFRTLYCAERRSTCLWEALWEMRPYPSTLAELKGPSTSLVGRVPQGWLSDRSLVHCRVEIWGGLVDIEDIKIRRSLEIKFATLLHRVGLQYLTISALRGPARELTQAITRDLYNSGAAGISYRSNIDNRVCFAIFEGRARIRQTGPSRPLAELPELGRVLGHLGLELGI